MCLYSWNYTVMHNQNEDKNEKKKPHRHSINRPRSWQEHKYGKYKYAFVWLCLYLLSKTSATIHEKFK